MDKVVLIHRMKRGYEMKDTDKKVNKKSNLKIYIIFAVMILASLLGGFLAGRLAAVNKDTLDGINWDHIWWITADTLPIVYGVLMLATFVVSFVMYGKIKRMIRGWYGQDEDVIVHIESRITTASYLPCVIVFVGLVLFPVCIYAVDRTYSDGRGTFLTVLSELVFLISMALYCVVEKLVIDEEKKLNPEKSGNIFDMHFRRDWENTSDEAELIMIAKSSKKGFMTGIKAGFVMWILTFMSMFAFDTGVMPIVAVGLVLIVMYVAYCREFVRLQK